MYSDSVLTEVHLITSRGHCKQNMCSQILLIICYDESDANDVEIKSKKKKQKQINLRAHDSPTKISLKIHAVS